MKKQAELGLDLSTKRARKAVFLDEMELVVPWRELLALIAAASPVASTGRPPFAHETMLRIHFLQQWFGLSDLAMEEALFETPLYRDFAGLSGTEWASPSFPDGLLSPLSPAQSRLGCSV